MSILPMLLRTLVITASSEVMDGAVHGAGKLNKQFLMSIYYGNLDNTFNTIRTVY